MQEWKGAFASFFIKNLPKVKKSNIIVLENKIESGEFHEK